MEFVIGEGPKRCSALKLNELVSHNDTAFWCYLHLMRLVVNIQIVVYKTTEQASIIDGFCRKRDLDGLSSYLDSIALGLINPHLFKEYIAQVVERATRAGKEAKAAELRECLYLN